MANRVATKQFMCLSCTTATQVRARPLRWLTGQQHSARRQRDLSHKRLPSPSPQCDETSMRTPLPAHLQHNNDHYYRNHPSAMHHYYRASMYRYPFPLWLGRAICRLFVWQSASGLVTRLTRRRWRVHCRVFFTFVTTSPCDDFTVTSYTTDVYSTLH